MFKLLCHPFLYPWLNFVHFIEGLSVSPMIQRKMAGNVTANQNQVNPCNIETEDAEDLEDVENVSENDNDAGS